MGDRATERRALFPAVLKYWRDRVGMSQLDLALAADVSARHVSFLETGRAQPSRDMVLRLANALGLRLRDQNAILSAAGFDEAFEEPNLGREMFAPVRLALDRMLQQQEPYPMVVMNRLYDIVQSNRAAMDLMPRFMVDVGAVRGQPNAMRMLFDPKLLRPFVVDWERSARGILSRLHTEALRKPSDAGLSRLIEELLTFPDVPTSFRQPDFSEPHEPTFALRLARGSLRLSFLSTLTAFSAPGNVTLDELRIESYFPLDAETEAYCRHAATPSSVLGDRRRELAEPR